MRIGLLAPPWVPTPPRGYGGTEAVLDVLSRGLQAAGHDVLLYTTGDSAAEVPIAWTYREAVGLGGGIDCIATETAHVCDAYERFRAEGVDLVHDHTISGPFRSMRDESGPPVVTTNHGPFDRTLSTIYRALATRVPIIAISRHQAATAQGIPIAAVIHHGLDVERVAPGRGDGGYALFLGRMCPTKGVHRAAALARAAGLRLRIAAKLQEPSEVVYFERRVAPLLGDDVEYVGEAAGDEKWDLLRGASCLLNPIAWPEPFGMVMLEALACGTPVVATPFGAVPEIVDDGVTGFVCEDDGALVAALGAVERLDRGACRRAAETRFSEARLAAEHVQLYERVLERTAVEVA